MNRRQQMLRVRLALSKGQDKRITVDDTLERLAAHGRRKGEKR